MSSLSVNRNDVNPPGATTSQLKCRPAGPPGSSGSVPFCAQSRTNTATSPPRTKQTRDDTHPSCARSAAGCGHTHPQRVDENDTLL